MGELALQAGVGDDAAVLALPSAGPPSELRANPLAPALYPAADLAEHGPVPPRGGAELLPAVEAVGRGLVAAPDAIGVRVRAGANQPQAQLLAQVPLAERDLGVREGLLDSDTYPVVGVADNAAGRAVERAQERIPVVARCRWERLEPPQQAASALVVAQRAEDVEGDLAARPRTSVGQEIANPERRRVKHERVGRPLPAPVRLKDDRGEDLHEVGHELAVARVALLAVLTERHAACPEADRRRGRPIAHAASHLDQADGDVAGAQQRLARRLRALVRVHRTLAVLAVARRRVLPRQRRRKAMPLRAVARDAAVALTAMTGGAVVAVEDHARVVVPARTRRHEVLRPCPRCPPRATPHLPKLNDSRGRNHHTAMRDWGSRKRPRAPHRSARVLSLCATGGSRPE